MQSLIQMFQSLIGLATPLNLLLLLVSTCGGILIGALPGLSATMGIALLAGLTYTMNQDMALIVLLGIYVGGIYGGSISATLIGIPGTGSAAATTLDGYPLAKKGLGREALSTVTIASFIGTLIGMIFLAFLTPALQDLSLMFASHEFALLAIFGVTICGTLTTEGSPLKGWIAGFFGLALSCVGYEQLFSIPRLTFGKVSLFSGIAFVPAMIGLFGLPNIFDNLSRGTSASSADVSSEKKQKISILGMVRSSFGNIFRSGIIGTAIGAIPGVGEDVAAWLSYDTAKRSSKHPEEFGNGSGEGIIAAEAGNNGATGGSLIPLLTLGIPGSAPAALFLGAMIIHGVRPGPTLFSQNAVTVYTMIIGFGLINLLMYVVGLIYCKFGSFILIIPKSILATIIVVLATVGTFATNKNMFDVWCMFFAGLFGYLMLRNDFPTSPVALALLLGANMEKAMSLTRTMYEGRVMDIFKRPLTTALLLFTIFSFVFPLVRMHTAKKRKAAAANASQEGDNT